MALETQSQVEFGDLEQLVDRLKSTVTQRHTMPADVAGLYHEPFQAVFGIVLAVYVTFRLFQDSRMQGVDLSRPSHPPRRWQKMQILNMLGN